MKENLRDKIYKNTQELRQERAIFGGSKPNFLRNFLNDGKVCDPKWAHIEKYSAIH